MEVYIKASTEIGNVICSVPNNADITNPFEDGLYKVSLRETIKFSYQFMLDNKYNHKDDHELRVITRKYEDNKSLSAQENSILAKKEISLLESNLFLYKNLVELAVHLD
uniref:hypothetical protein n=1 Tax=Aeromonas jandaei TaxID=650 RepID=UPI003B9FCE4C